MYLIVGPWIEKRKALGNLFRGCYVLLKYLKDGLVQALQLAREREDCVKKKLRKWKENAKSILRGWRQTPHDREWAKRGIKTGSTRQGSPKESGKDTVFWKLVQPTTDKCAKALVHFVGSCSRLASNPYQESYHQASSALHWSMHCQ